MRALTFTLLLLLVHSTPASTQGLAYLLGGTPVGGEATAENSTKLGLPVFTAGLETSLVGPVRGRLSIHYGLDWALFKDPCADCNASDVIQVDPAKHQKHPPIGLSGDLTLERSLGNRIGIGAFAGVGVAQSQQGDIDREIEDDYRVSTHVTSFLTAGAEVYLTIYKKLDAVARARYAYFMVGEQEITLRYDRDPTQFLIDNGNVGGMIVMFGLRFRPQE